MGRNISIVAVSAHMDLTPAQAQRLIDLDKTFPKPVGRLHGRPLWSEARIVAWTRRHACDPRLPTYGRIKR